MEVYNHNSRAVTCNYAGNVPPRKLKGVNRGISKNAILSIFQKIKTPMF